MNDNQELTIQIGDMITDPEDGSLGIVFENLYDEAKWKIYWFHKYFGITKEKYAEVTYTCNFNNTFYKVS